MDQDLPGRIRHLLADVPDTDERRMFGGVCFMVAGNMVACSIKDGNFLVRVGAGAMMEALARPGVRRMQMAGREMKDFVQVAPELLDGAALADWLTRARAHVATLPPKPGAGRRS